MSNTNGDYDETPYYNLPLYLDSTPQDLRDGYNRAMRLLDSILHELSTQIENQI